MKFALFRRDAAGFHEGTEGLGPFALVSQQVSSLIMSVGVPGIGGQMLLQVMHLQLMLFQSLLQDRQKTSSCISA